MAGNAIRILRDSTENWSEWEKAIATATKWIHGEMYIIGNDEVGPKIARQKTPLHTGWKTSSTTPSQAGCLDEIDHL